MSLSLQFFLYFVFFYMTLREWNEKRFIESDISLKCCLSIQFRVIHFRTAADWIRAYFFVCMCLCAFKIYSQQNLTVILRMCLGNKKYELKLSPCISVGGHSDGGGDAKCGEERRAEEVLVGRAGPSERGDDWAQETRESAAESGTAGTRHRPGRFERSKLSPWVWCCCVCRRRTTSSGLHILTRCRGGRLSSLQFHQRCHRLSSAALIGESGSPCQAFPSSGMLRAAVEQTVSQETVWIQPVGTQPGPGGKERLVKYLKDSLYTIHGDLFVMSCRCISVYI